MGLLQDLRDRFIVAPVAKQITEGMKSLEKAATSDITRWQQPIGFNAMIFNQRKPGSDISFNQLRSMSTFHDITRACINIRKQQITQLNWDITTTDTDDDAKKYIKEIGILKNYFKTIGGAQMNMRKLLDLIIEDYLVLDAVALYKKTLRDGAVVGLIPVDSTTIKLRVAEDGGTPTPPDIAYEQWIRGEMVNELTTNELIYDMLNPRSNTPYGFSVLEALVINIEAAFKANLYTVGYFTDGTMPDGFYELPSNWSTQQVQQFQEWFDGMLSGDPRLQRKIRFMPGSDGKGFTATKDFDFSTMEPYMMWLMQVTCSLFGVMPQELGFTADVNLANAYEQTEIAKRNSIRPMANAIADIFNSIVQSETLAVLDAKGNVTGEYGPFPELKFTFLDLDIKDELIDSQVAERMIKVGAISVDDWRKDKGLDPIGVGPYILTPQGPILMETLVNPMTVSGTGNNQKPDLKPNVGAEQDALDTSPEQEIKRWEKKALADYKAGRSYRKFYSEVLDNYTLTHLEHDLYKCTTREDIHELFDRWNEIVKEGVTYDVERIFHKLDSLAE